jgi:hypothetical protein
MFAAGEAKIFNYDNYITTCNEIYGPDLVKEAERLIARRESNGILIKMMLAILAFSSNCSIVLPDYTFDLTNSSMTTTNSVILIRTQDVFIVLLWKYLVYQYGFIEAVRRLNNLVKCHLDLLNQMNEISNKQHVDMIDMIIRKATQSLTLDN